MLAAEGLTEVRVHDQDEVAVRGSDHFSKTAGIWLEVIDRLGPAMIDDGWCDATLLRAASLDYLDWYPTELRRHTLSMKTTVARVPE